MGLLNPHLDDDDCADVWSARLALGAQESDRPAESHLRKCAECRARYSDFTAWIDGLRTDAHAEADETFTREKLAAQHAQIFRRLESLEQPARIIAFPRFARPVSVPVSGGRRWIAAAAVVGLITGVGLGQLMELPGRSRQPESLAQSGPKPAVVETVRAAQPASADNDDETFLNEPEVTTSQARVPDSLQYLNAITPGARDYDPR